MNWIKLDKGRLVDIVYFDFSKAFDKVPTRRLLVKFEHFGIRSNLLRWIEECLTHRLFRVKIGNSLSSHCGYSAVYRKSPFKGLCSSLYLLLILPKLSRIPLFFLKMT